MKVGYYSNIKSLDRLVQKETNILLSLNKRVNYRVWNFGIASERKLSTRIDFELVYFLRKICTYLD